MKGRLGIQESGPRAKAAEEVGGTASPPEKSGESCSAAKTSTLSSCPVSLGLARLMLQVLPAGVRTQVCQGRPEGFLVSLESWALASLGWGELYSSEWGTPQKLERCL